MATLAQGHCKNDGVVILQILQSEGTGIAPQNPFTTARVGVVANIFGHTGALQCEDIAEPIDPFQPERATGCLCAKKLASAGNAFVVVKTVIPGLVFPQ